MTPQNDIVVTGKRIVQAVQNHPYIATGKSLRVGAALCPECDVAEIVVTARRENFFTGYTAGSSNDGDSELIDRTPT